MCGKKGNECLSMGLQLKLKYFQAPSQGSLEMKTAAYCKAKVNSSIKNQRQKREILMSVEIVASVWQTKLRKRTNLWSKIIKPNLVRTNG